MTNEYKDNADRLTAELIGLYPSARTVNPDESMRTDWRTEIDANGSKYHIVRDWKGYVQVSPAIYMHRVNVSQYVYSSEWKAIATSNNIKAITKKAIDAKIAEHERMAVRLAELEAIAEKKVSEFMAEVEPLNPTVFKGPIDGKVKSGYIVRNGIEFAFEVHEDGYVSQKISVHYTTDNSIDAFIRLTSK
jgi:hypothetical protein